MSRTFHRGERRIRARGVRQDPPDLRRIARALIALAEAQAEADAEAMTTGAIPNSGTRQKAVKRQRGDVASDDRKESA